VVDNEHEDRIKQLKQMIEVQCSNGNWDWSPYMRGLANGMIYSLSILEDTEPTFLEPPEIWLVDKKSPKHCAVDHTKLTSMPPSLSNGR